jgi:hypothetical protein
VRPSTASAAQLPSSNTISHPNSAAEVPTPRRLSPARPSSQHPRHVGAHGRAPWLPSRHRSPTNTIHLPTPTTLEVPMPWRRLSTCADLTSRGKRQKEGRAKAEDAPNRSDVATFERLAFNAAPSCVAGAFANLGLREGAALVHRVTIPRRVSLRSHMAERQTTVGAGLAPALAAIGQDPPSRRLVATAACNTCQTGTPRRGARRCANQPPRPPNHHLPIPYQPRSRGAHTSASFARQTLIPTHTPRRARLCALVLKSPKLEEFPQATEGGVL